MDKIITYRRQCKENAENLEKLYKPITAAPAQRTALATIAPNRMSQVQTAKPVRVPFSQGITTKQRPCPNCQSPAKELNLRRAECTNCQFDFCQHCFKPWHEGECSGRMSPSKRPRQTETVCGTKKSKKRLRRLWPQDWYPIRTLLWGWTGLAWRMGETHEPLLLGSGQHTP